MTVVDNPFIWLQNLEIMAQKKAKGIPRQEKIQKMWRGIAFRLDEAKLIAPIKEIREILITPTHLARVPGAKPWIKGIANVRGLLLPVVDLQACLGHRPLVLDNKCRMMILNQPGVSSGVLVTEVLGIKHFPLENQLERTPFSQPWYDHFVRGGFRGEQGDEWTIFDMDALSQSRQFLDAAS